MALTVPRENRNGAQSKVVQDYFQRQTSTPELVKLRNETKDLKEQRKKIVASFPTTMVMQDMARKRDTFMLVRGQYDQKGEKVEPGLPRYLGGGAKQAENRLDLAQWLVSRDNPLTARVAVNRLWQHHFGTGLVKTSEDFGVQGERPSHPGLLDWLAVNFAENGWDMKRIHRLIVTSAAYRQSSTVTPELLGKDPENRLLSRGSRLRLEAEVIRDSALEIGGLLEKTAGGRGVFPYQPSGLWMELNNRRGYSKAYARSKGEGLYRRSVYTYWKRTVPPPTMQLFDAPGREFCVVQRSRTTTPLQALALLHDPQFVEAARHFAERTLDKGGATEESRIIYAFRVTLARTPTDEEINTLLDIYRAERKEFTNNHEAAKRLLSVGDSKRNEELDPVDHATWTSIARVLLNLDETITKP